MKVSSLDSDKQITMHAFLDNGSDATLCLRGVLEELNLESEPTDFMLTTVNHGGNECCRRASLKIEALDGKTKFTLDQVLTTECLPIGEKHFANNRELRRCPHLDGIYLSEVDPRKVSILIGSDWPDIIDNNSEIRRETTGQPYAVNTPLGWTVYGPMGESSGDGVSINFVESDHEEMLCMQLNRLYNTEFRDSLVDVGQSLSVTYQRAE